MASAVDQLAARPPGGGDAVKARTIPWVAVAWFAALLIAAFFPVLRHLVEQWSTDEDVGHGFFVPVIAAFIAWKRRDEILAADLKPNWWGLAVMALSLIHI